jgi:hypothetical protein
MLIIPSRICLMVFKLSRLLFTIPLCMANSRTYSFTGCKKYWQSTGVSVYGYVFQGSRISSSCSDAKPVWIRRPLRGSLSSSEARPLSRPLVHCIIIRPAIEVGWHDILLAQQSAYQRMMIDGVGDGLDQHDDDRSLIAPPVKMEDLTQFPLLRDGDRLFSRPLCSSPQFVEAWKHGEFLQSRGRGCSSNMPHIAFFGSEQVQECFSHTAKRPFRGRGQVCTRVEQTQVRPEVLRKKVGKSWGHCSDLLP